MHRFCVLVTLVIALPVCARLKITATIDGRPATDAEVCFYKAQLADPREALFSPTISCQPSGMVLDLPARSFGYYLRTADAITPHHGLITGTGNPKAPVIEHTIALTRAARLDTRNIPRTPGTHLAAIIFTTKSNRAATAPLDERDGVALIPADTPLVVLVMNGNRPSWASVPLVVKPGATAQALAATGTTALLWFRSDDPDGPVKSGACVLPHSNAYLELLLKQEMPSVWLSDASGKTWQPSLTVPSPAHVLDGMYVIQGMPAGQATIHVSGGRFVTHDDALDLTTVTLLKEPVRLELGSSVSISAELPPPTRTSCEADPDSAASVSMWFCPQGFTGVRITPELTQRCTKTATRPVSGDRHIEVGGLTVGTYLVSMERQSHIMRLEPVTLVRGTTTYVDWGGGSPFVSGRVLRDGKPVGATVRFSTGSAASDPDTGEYHALLTGPPGSNIVQVLACDDSFAYVHRPDREIPLGAGYDLSIPANDVTVTVEDGETGNILTDASVTLAVIEKVDEPDRALYHLPASLVDGRAVIDSIEPRTIVRACASRAGYEQRCEAPLTIRRDHETVRLTLKRLGHRGLVSVEGYRKIFWTRPDGTISEVGEIDGQGGFSYSLELEHEHAVLVGSAPLIATSAWTVDAEGVLHINPSLGTTQSTTVVLAASFPQDKAIVSLWVDGLPIPVSALSAHQIARHERWFASKERPMLIRDVASQQGMQLIIGPDFEHVRTNMDDPFNFAGKAPIPAQPETIVR